MYKTYKKNIEDLKNIQAKIKSEKLLLHVCCAPCSLEPYKIFKEAGWDITIFYSNDNIFPKSEFEKRYFELEKWCKENNINLIKDVYDEKSWKHEIQKFAIDKPKTEIRKIRCGACYEHRLKKAAEYASKNNIKFISSSLAVSPYQHNYVLKEKLDKVSKIYNLNSVFMDFRPYYQDATAESKKLGMYRQKYCGCELSLNESIEQFKKSKNKKYLKEVLAIKQA